VKWEKVEPDTQLENILKRSFDYGHEAAALLDWSKACRFISFVIDLSSFVFTVLHCLLGKAQKPVTTPHVERALLWLSEEMGRR
jgi:hypothetical protein